MKMLRRALVAAIALILFAFPAGAQEGPPPDPHAGHDHAAGDPHAHPEEEFPPPPIRRRTAPWPKDVVELAGSLPVQHEGRVKPLSTMARFALLGMSGRTSARVSDDEDEERISATEWLLDCLFFPDSARRYPVLRVQDSETLVAIGIGDAAKRKRDWYSFEEIAKGAALLEARARLYDKKERRDRNHVEEEVVNLYLSFDLLKQLLHFLDFLYLPEATGSSTALALLPPSQSVKERPEWFTPAALVTSAARAKNPADFARQTSMALKLSRMARSGGDMAVFRSALELFHADVVSAARERGEYGRVPVEVFYYKAKLPANSLILFLVGFLFVAIGWLRPANRWLYRGGNGALILGLSALIVAIVLRCIIVRRPPVTTLYETILFITATAVATALVMEWINRRRIGLSVAAALGVLGMFLANRYEAKDGADTMRQLMAVLDTNFWLSTHVTTVTLGYAAGLLAAAIAHVYLFGKLFGAWKKRPEVFRNIARMVYGVVCFGLFFSVLGTILGGIWANESWGRFWGWDPKENGALMIVLFELAMLHALMGGYIRDFGLCMASVFLAIIVAFSWWGVNLLEVGLHSYGFTSGVKQILIGFYGLELLVMGAALTHRFLTQPPKPPKSPPAPPREEAVAAEWEA